MPDPLERLRHHVTGAIERGEKTAITGLDCVSAGAIRKRFAWQKEGHGWSVKIDNITLYASPDRTRFGKPVRGTKWRAGVSSWNESTRTISRFGRDVYSTLCDNAKDAMRLAETVYNESI